MQRKVLDFGIRRLLNDMDVHGRYGVAHGRVPHPCSAPCFDGGRIGPDGRLQQYA